MRKLCRDRQAPFANQNSPKAHIMTTRTRPCPICKKPRVEAFSPFCSQRCKDRDLAQWFGDGYALPAEPASPEEIASTNWQEQD